MADEPRMISFGAYGDGEDFFTLKGWVELLLGELCKGRIRFEADRDNPSYHPGRCAAVYLDSKRVGVFGQIHPKVTANYGVDTEFYCAELSFDVVYAYRKDLAVYKPLPRFPSVTRDIALLCDREIPVGRLSECILSSGGQYLRECELFDVYEGERIPAGKKSVAFSLTMRADDQTLTDDHAEETLDGILKALREEYGAVIR